MKKIIISLMLILPVGFTSCELDTEPYGYLENTEAWETYTDMERQYTGLLSYLRGVCGGSQMYLPDLMSDLFNARFNCASYTTEHTWTWTAGQFAGDNIYANNYALLKSANDLLGHIDTFIQENADDLGDTELYELRQHRGTAYFARAFAYMNMMMRFCKDYNPATAASDLGLCIVTEVDEHARPSRSSLQATCDATEQYLDSAKTYLHAERAERDADDIVNAYGEPTYYAALALSARFYLYTRQYQKAIDACQEVMESGNFGLVNSENGMYDLWAFDNQLGGLATEIIYMPTQTPNEQANSYSTIFVNYDFRTVDLESTYYAQNPYYIPTQGLLDLYESGDLRKEIYFNTEWYLKYFMSNFPYSGAFGVLTTPDDSKERGYCFTKFPGNYFLCASSLYEVVNMAKPFRLAELYLIAAESNYMLGDNGAALDYLNELRDARSASPLEVDGDELFQQIKDEWTREYVGEGFRLYNLRRWHEGFKRMTPQTFTSSMVRSSVGNTDLEISADDRRFVWEIPQNDLNANPNIQRNWAE